MKRGSINLTLENIIGLVLAAILVPAIIYFIVGVTGLLSTTPDQSTVNSFDALLITINQLVNASGDKEIQLAAYPDKKIIPSSGNAYQVVIPYSLEDDFGLIGFDRDVLGQYCGTFNPDMDKPTQCLRLPCLCLARLGVATVDNYERCDTLKKVKSVSVTPESTQFGNFGKIHETGAGGNNLVLWSECSPAPGFGVKNVKIVRVPSGEAGTFDLLFDISPVKR